MSKYEHDAVANGRAGGASNKGFLISSIRYKPMAVLAGLMCFLACVWAGSALAEDQVSSSTLYAVSTEDLGAVLDPNNPSAVDLEADINSLAARTLPHESLSRSEAGELLTAVFGSVLDSSSGGFEELEDAKFLSPTVAIVGLDESVNANDESDSTVADIATDAQQPYLKEPLQSEPALIESTFPLRVEDSEGHESAVNLELEAVNGQLRPDNPLVEVSIPGELQDGISLPEQEVSIHLSGAPHGRSPSLLGESAAFYPNIARDSDLTVIPTPTGVETFTQLRSAEAPTTQNFALGLPTGATLVSTSDGGAEVRHEGDLLLSVAPPTATDADGRSVPASLAVSGDSIHLHVSTIVDTTYPVLLDPIYETYDWPKYYEGKTFLPDAEESPPGWYPANTAPSTYALYNRIPWASPAERHWGLNIFSGRGPFSPGTQANWNYYVPKYFSDFSAYSPNVRPTTYIKHVTLRLLEYRLPIGDPRQDSPYFQGGIWDSTNGGWISVATRLGSEGELKDPNYEYQFDNGNWNKNAKNFGVALLSAESGPTIERRLSVGAAIIELMDPDNPTIDSKINPDAWVNDQPTAKVSFATTDLGLGVSKLTMDQPNLGGAARRIVETKQGCVGNASSPCPRYWKSTSSGMPQLSYDPTTMPQGENRIGFSAYDPLGHKTGESGELESIVKIKVDHTKPNLAITGSLTEQAKVGNTAAQYVLKYSASDGDSSAPIPLAPFGGTGTESGKTQRPSGIAVDASGNVFVVEKDNNRVSKFDPTGKFLMKFGSAGSGNGQFKEPRGIAIAPNGDLWIADSGNARVQHFSSAGAYKSQFGVKGAGNLPSEMLTPYGIAVGFGTGALSGTLLVYVSDSAKNVVRVYTESGSFGTGLTGSASNPSGPAIFGEPSGLAIDAGKNVWVADAQNNRVQRFNSEGKFVLQFGTKGAGNGQLSGPINVAVAPSGNIFVVDGANHRIQEFSINGEYLRQFGSSGSSSSQFSDPKGIVVGLDGTAYVSDAGNHRVARWNHADYDPQSGVAATEVKIDGALVEPKFSPGCVTQNCSISKEWVMNADQYAVGQHNVEVKATDGAGLSMSKNLLIETHGDRVPPALALSGSMTEQSSLGPSRPAYTLKVDASDPGSAQERKSGVASMTIKVDDALVDSVSPGCPAGGCSLFREWTLKSNDYSAGSHTVQVVVTDAAGRSTTKTLNLTITRDTAPPQIIANGGFFSAPEGWVEQGAYAYATSAADANGYGVTTFTLKIDGTVVKSATQTCAAGSCSLGLSGSINMAAYDGGAHSAELIAIDGASNVGKKAWTINVDPKGSISVAEAEATLDAAEATGSINTVGPAEEEDEYEGTVEDLTLEPGTQGFEAQGNALVPTTINTGPGAGATIEVLDPAILQLACEEESGAEELPVYNGKEEEELADKASPDQCSPSSESSSSGYTSVSILPKDVGAGAGNTTLVYGETAAVSTNVGQHTDLITRPLYDGAMTYAAIRDASASETYAWTVPLDEDQELKQIDSKHIQAYEEGDPAFSITAAPARDAVGKDVSTSLALTAGNVLTLTVAHRSLNAEGSPYVYPVVGGAGWQGGFQTYTVEMPPPEPMPGEGEEGEGEVGEIEPGLAYLKTVTFGPPVAGGTVGNLISWKNHKDGVPVRARAYVFNSCRFSIKDIPATVPSGVKLRRASQQCHNPSDPGSGDFIVRWATAISGVFYYKYGHEVAIKEKPNCNKWGPERPGEVDCLVVGGQASWVSNWRINLLGRYRFLPGRFGGSTYGAGQPVCFELNGVLPIRPQPSENGERIYHSTYHEFTEAVLWNSSCPWGNLRDQLR